MLQHAQGPRVIEALIYVMENGGLLKSFTYIVYLFVDKTVLLRYTINIHSV